MAKLVPFGYILLVVSVGLFVFYGINLRQQNALKSWPTAPATIEYSKLARTKKTLVTHVLENRAVAPDPRYNEEDVWDVQLQYRFQLNGQEYTGQRATQRATYQEIDAVNTEPNAALVSLSQELPQGKKLPVHYDPNDPDKNYLLYKDVAAFTILLQWAWGLAGLGIILVVVPKFA